MKALLKSPSLYLAFVAIVLPFALSVVLFRAWVAEVAGPDAAAEFAVFASTLGVAMLPLAFAAAAFLARLVVRARSEQTEKHDDELERTQRRLLRAERIAAWRDIAQRIAHEIKNPLQPIRMSIETLRRTRESGHEDFDAIFAETTSTVLEETRRLERIVSEFSRFARLPRPRPSDVDLYDVVDGVARLLRDDRFSIEVRKPDDAAVVRADREQITQVVMNLVQNAKEAIPAAPGTIVLRFSTADDKAAVTLECADDGPGIPPDMAQNIFEPYFTTKTTGSGLGLAIAHRIAVDHHGTLELLPSERGARFRLTLPVAGPPADASASTSEALGLIRG